MDRNSIEHTVFISIVTILTKEERPEMEFVSDPSADAKTKLPTEVSTENEENKRLCSGRDFWS